ncbi:MAG: Ig-like domain-containing protein [Nitrospirae bacterium]|nr:Ig-like domain-containing protein [Nitrospirota bacterium]
MRVRMSMIALLAIMLCACGGGGGGSSSSDSSGGNASATLVSIMVSPTTSIVIAGSTQQFMATGTYSDNSSKTLTQSATWISSNTAIATIDAAGLVSALSAGTTTITATSGTISVSATLTVTTAVSQPPINITMDLHCDPLNQQLTLDDRRIFFRRQLANAAWLIDYLEPYGVKVSFLAVGECYEFCVEASEQATCLPLLARLQASGGILGTHSHTEYYRGVHDWPSIANAYTNPDPNDVRKVWDANKRFTDMAVTLALGLTDAAAIAAVNTAAESHAQLTDPNQLMKEYGYTIREGGGDQIMAGYFSHVPWNPFRPGQTAITEDLTTKFMTVPQGMVIGQVGDHLGLWQDGKSSRKKAEFLQLYANWKERTRAGAKSKVWAFGWGVHTQDLDYGSESRAAIMDLIPWLRDEFVSRADSTGKPPARFSSYIDVRDEYLAWEAEHPGVSSFNYAAKATDYSQYPYLEWANRYLRFARFDSRITARGADIFLMKAGNYSGANPTTYPFVMAIATSSPTSVNLSSTFGPVTLKSIKLNTGSVSDVPAVSVSLDAEPIVLCISADCDAILALENASSGTACGSVICNSGKVCATDVSPNVCVPDCRILGNSCPAIRPLCNQTAGVCH